MKELRNRICKTYILLFLLIECTCLPAQKTIDITYIANEGFMICAGKQKVMIDGIFSNAYNKYHTPTTLALAGERGGLSPFDSVTVLLNSHKHDDHINVNYVAEHMVNDNKPVLICPAQVYDLLKPLTNFNTIKTRIHAITPGYAVRVDTTIQQVGLTVMSFQHPNDSKKEIQNIGYIIHINGFNIYHAGDAVADSLTNFQNLKLNRDSIDIAFFSRWYFDTEYGDKGAEIMKYINPKVIIAMHINTDKYAYYRTAAAAIPGIAPVYFMDTPMNILSFTKADGGAVISETGIVQMSADSSNPLHIYPNPSNGSISIDFGVATHRADIEVYSSMGSLVYSNSFLNVSRADIALTGYSPAVYVMKVKTEGHFYSQKIYLNGQTY